MSVSSSSPGAAASLPAISAAQAQSSHRHSNVRTTSRPDRADSFEVAQPGDVKLDLRPTANGLNSAASFAHVDVVNSDLSDESVGLNTSGSTSNLTHRAKSPTQSTASAVSASSSLNNDASPPPPFHQTYFGGKCSAYIEGPGIYFMGIIDVLQEWTFDKKLEAFFKRYFRLLNPFGISARPPLPYAERFVLMMRQHLDIPLCSLLGLEDLKLRIVDQMDPSAAAMSTSFFGPTSFGLNSTEDSNKGKGKSQKSRAPDSRRILYLVQATFKDDMVLENWESQEQIMSAAAVHLIEEFLHASPGVEGAAGGAKAPLLAKRKSTAIPPSRQSRLQLHD